MTRWGMDPNSPEADLVTIRVFAKQAELMLARSALESADIECFCKDENAMRISHTAPNTALQVRKRDAEDARAILDAPLLNESYVIDE